MLCPRDGTRTDRDLDGLQALHIRQRALCRIRFFLVLLRQSHGRHPVPDFDLEAAAFPMQIAFEDGGRVAAEEFVARGRLGKRRGAGGQCQRCEPVLRCGNRESRPFSAQRGAIGAAERLDGVGHALETREDANNIGAVLV